MTPFKSSLAKTAKKLLGLFNQTDLSLRGATQDTRVPEPWRSAMAVAISGGVVHQVLDGSVFLEPR